MQVKKHYTMNSNYLSELNLKIVIFIGYCIKVPKLHKVRHIKNEKTLRFNLDLILQPLTVTRQTLTASEIKTIKTFKDKNTLKFCVFN